MTHRRSAERDPFRSPPDSFADGHARLCAWKGCEAAGKYRAPKDRDLAEYHQFCLEHVRAYNASWDFNADLTPAEIEMEIRRSVTWDRPHGKSAPQAHNFIMAEPGPTIRSALALAPILTTPQIRRPARPARAVDARLPRTPRSGPSI